MGGFIYYAMALASILNFFMPVSMAVNPNCDYRQDMMLGKQYYIYNPQYPSVYGPSTSCRWTASSEPGTTILITCEDISLPVTNGCSGDRLAISLTGNEMFTDSKNYCGTGTVSLVSQGNKLTIGLFSASNSPGGKMSCAITTLAGSTNDPTQSPGACNCGWKKETRIVGGEETGVNEFPSMAGLVNFQRREVFCGGSIITQQYVLSAAHCVIKTTSDQVGILVGDHDLTSGMDTGTSVLYPVSGIISHPDYNSNTQINDLAILKTQDIMKFSIAVGPACLPFRYTSSDFYGQMVTVLGWGQLEFSGPTSNTLQKVNLTIVSNSECALSQSQSVITSGNICTYAPGKDACQYDSGGPLLWMDTSTKNLQLIGIISHGLGCATQRPGINTRVTSYLAWIVSVTSDSSYCIK